MTARAPELRLTPPNVCPSCGQTIKATCKRVCGACGRAITRGHKFFFDGSTVKHRVCSEPDEYTAGAAADRGRS